MPPWKRKIDSKLARLYELVPQLRQYHGMRADWKPFVMFTNQSNLRSEVINTDGHGFRYTWHRDGWLDFNAFQYLAGQKGIICGGSTAFGVGASDDSKTIPSLLNQQSGTTWFNFSGRASNSTQELLTFMFHLPQVNHVVLVSGVNNLATLALSVRYTLPFGGFLGDSKFYEIEMSRSQWVRRLIERRIRRLMRQPQNAPQETSNGAKLDLTLQIVERDLEVWRILRDTLGFSLSYALQPFATWTDKLRSPEETELFDDLDRFQGPQQQALYQQITDSYPMYAVRLQAMCDLKKIKFIDLNRLLPEEGWLFCDRVHLTDQGISAATSAIKSELQLS